MITFKIAESAPDYIELSVYLRPIQLEKLLTFCLITSPPCENDVGRACSISSTPFVALPRRVRFALALRRLVRFALALPRRLAASRMVCRVGSRVDP